MNTPLKKLPLLHPAPLAALTLVACCLASTESQAGQIAMLSDPQKTTHTLASGNMTLGISSRGGGFINQITLPVGLNGEKVDVVGPASSRYGRGGQTSFVDELHSRAYNPTQAGFTDVAGTVCTITSSSVDSVVTKLTIAPHPVCLYRRGEYDFTQSENLVNDQHNSDNSNSDADDLDESQLPSLQADELTSEFEYSGAYENWKGKTGATYEQTNVIAIPCIKYSYEYRYKVNPTSGEYSAIHQFINGTTLNTGLRVDDISVNAPAGTHPIQAVGGVFPTTQTFSMGVMRCDLTFRMDTSIWAPGHIYWVNSSNELAHAPLDTTTKKNFVVSQNDTLIGRTSLSASSLAGGANPDRSSTVPLIILSDGTNEATSKAIGLYFPNNTVNTDSVQGVRYSDGSIAYSDNRTMQVAMSYNPNRVPSNPADEFQLFGFFQTILRLLQPERIGNDTYETLRGECYILHGSPGTIYNNAQRIQPF